MRCAGVPCAEAMHVCRAVETKARAYDGLGQHGTAQPGDDSSSKRLGRHVACASTHGLRISHATAKSSRRPGANVSSSSRVYSAGLK
eukprot:scaffold1723_cov104-Isochrysis_galbana.AAC.4